MINETARRVFNFATQLGLLALLLTGMFSYTRKPFFGPWYFKLFPVYFTIGFMITVAQVMTMDQVGKDALPHSSTMGALTVVQVIFHTFFALVGYATLTWRMVGKPDIDGVLHNVPNIEPAY
jgi:hypothetical protein